MTKFIILISFIFFTNLSFSQIPFPDVYCNGEKVENGIIKSYFIPAELDFKFSSSDSSYSIRKGFINFCTNPNSDSILFTSNHFRREMTNMFPCGIRVTIKEVEVKYKDIFVRIDTTTLIQTFTKPFVPMSKDEAKVINNNNGVVYCNNKIVDCNKVLILKEENLWSVSNVGDYTDSIELQITMVRGKRPVAQERLNGTSGSETRLAKFIQKGDFALIRVWKKNPREIIFNKVVFVKK